MNANEKVLREALAKDKWNTLTHMALADLLEEQGLDDEALYHRLWTKEWEQSKDRLEEFGRQHGGVYNDDYDSTTEMPLEQLIGIMKEWVETYDPEEGYGNDYTQYGRSSLQGNYTKELWKDYEVYTRSKVEDNAKKSPFSCSC